MTLLEYLILRTKEYFSVSNFDYELWSWSPDGSAILWADNEQIASADELLQVLRLLQTRGLPRFSTIVQVFAACRGKSIFITWHPPSQDQKRNLRVPCVIETIGKRSKANQRIRLFGTPEEITAAAVWLPTLRVRLEDKVEESAATVRLVSAVCQHLAVEAISEGMIRYWFSGAVTGEELNHPSWHSSHPDVLLDLLALSRVFKRIQPPYEAAPTDPAAHDITPTRTAAPRWTVAREIRLPIRRRWQAAVSVGSHFLATSLADVDGDDRLILVRGSWDGHFSHVRWEEAAVDSEVRLAPLHSASQCLVYQTNRSLLPNQFIGAGSGLERKGFVVGGGGWLPSGTLRVAAGETRVWVLRHEPEYEELQWTAPGGFGYFDFDSHPPKGPEALRTTTPDGTQEATFKRVRYSQHIRLACCDRQGQRYSSGPVEVANLLLTQPETPFDLCACEQSVAVAVGNRVAVFNDNRLVSEYELPSGIRKLAYGFSLGRHGFLASHEKGFSLHWFGSDEMLEIGHAPRNGIACFFGADMLMICGEGGGSVYRLKDNAVEHIGEVPWSGPAPVVIFPTPNPQEVALLTEDGRIMMLSNEQ